MVVRAVKGNGSRLNIRPAVSEEFVVVTKRTKNLKKQEIPSLDDPISKLNHIGKETVKKLNEIKASADEMNLDLKLPRELWRVTKVREFQRVAKLCEADGHMQQKLKQLLKLSKEKWDAACEHAKTAVQVDNRMRAWYIKNMSVGLLYQCSLGDLRLDSPVALLQNRRHEGLDFMEVVPMEHQLPAQRDQVQASCEQAMRLWWEDYHPGWMIFTLGNQHFETLNQIIQYSQSSVIKGGLAPLQEDAYGGPEARANGLANDFSSFGQKASDLSRRESLSFGGHHPWPAPQPGTGGAGSRGAHQMSAQEESAALLSQMFAQQLAGNQSYANPMPEEGRAGPKQPSRVIIEGSKPADGQGSEAGGSRSSAPNPFEGLTGLPFQAQQETGKRDATTLAEASWNGPSPGWMEQLGALGSVNSDVGQHNNATLLPSLLSLTNFAKNTSLGSFTSQNLADISTLSSVPGDELIPGMEAKARFEEGKGTGAELVGTVPGQVLVGPGKGAFGGGADLTEWGQQRNPWDDGNPQDTAGPSGRRNQGTEKQEDSDQYQGMFWKQLQQQRQQQQKREDGFGKEASQQQHRQENGFHISGLSKPGGHESAVAHFTQLQRGRTPPGSPHDEPHQAWTRAPSSSPQPEPNHVRSRPSSGAHRDPRSNRPSSLSREPEEAQGRAASGSPRHDGKGKPSTCLSELAQAIEPSVKGKDQRQAQQKRKRSLASSNLPHKAKQRRSVNDRLPAGTAEVAHAGASERAQPQERPQPGIGASAPGPSDNAAGLHGDTQRVETQRDAWDSSGDGLLSKDNPDQFLRPGPSDMYNSNPDTLQAAIKGSQDNPPDGGYHERSASPHADDPAYVGHAGTQSQTNMPGVAHDLNRMVEHMTGHLHSSADEDDAEAEDEEATADENTDSDGKLSQPDVDVVN
ncbi:TPA: PSII 6.1 kDa protein, variant 2 [Trebouxia sp. C0005]